MDSHAGPQVHRMQAEIFGGETALRERVLAFKQALGAHAHTVGVPAPTEDTLVEQLARFNDFTVADNREAIPKDDIAGVTIPERIADLEARLAKLEARLEKGLG